MTQSDPGMLEFDLDSHLVLKVVGGSNAYGTAIENSDEDFRGVIIPPEEYFTGFKVFKQFAPKPDGPFGDVVYYDIRKFLQLAAKGNPSVLEVFHAPRLRVSIPFGNSILSLWESVLSKTLVKSHLGMAKDHVRRIDMPNRKCGEKGKASIEKHGYNTKDACHVIRILEQCIEILMTKTLTMPRPNADILLAIKNGEWSCRKFKSCADDLVDVVKDLESKSDLPNLPDFNKLSRNCMHIVHGWIYSKRSGGELQFVNREE